MQVFNNISFYHDFLESKVPIKERLSVVKNILTNPSMQVCCWKVKEVYKIIYHCFKIDPCCKFLDPKVGNWIIDSESCDKSLSDLVHFNIILLVINNSYFLTHWLISCFIYLQTVDYFSKGQKIAKYYQSACESTLVESQMKRVTAQSLLVWFVTGEILNTLSKLNPILPSIYEGMKL